MKALILGLFVFCLPTMSLAAGGVELDHIEPDHADKASLQRGAALFTNYCMACHSLQYARYKSVAEDLGIPDDIYEDNLIFTGAKIGELMKIGMKPEMAKSWFGNPSPDLTLEARLRGDDWIYSYLRGFYKDESRPWGVNNVVFNNVGMPHVLVQMQGLCAVKPGSGEGHSDEASQSDGADSNAGCSDWAIEGSMKPGQFDAAMYDLTNFLSYISDPVKLQRERLGIFVLLFIAVFFIFAYLLNREYWKDVH